MRCLLLVNEQLTDLARFDSHSGVRINNPKFYQQNGFDFEARDYILRPEVLESV